LEIRRGEDTAPTYIRTNQPILGQNTHLFAGQKNLQKTLAEILARGYFLFHVLCEINSGKEVDRPPLKQIRESPDFRRVSGSDKKQKRF
jgi:hypothetical protein